MAHVISDECVSCGSCEGECPVGAISEGDGKYEIDADACRFLSCSAYSNGAVNPALVTVIISRLAAWDGDRRGAHTEIPTSPMRKIEKCRA